MWKRSDICLIDIVQISFLQVRTLTAACFYASLLKAVNGVVSLALFLRVMFLSSAMSVFMKCLHQCMSARAMQAMSISQMSQPTRWSLGKHKFTKMKWENGVLARSRLASRMFSRTGLIFGTIKGVSFGFIQPFHWVVSHQESLLKEPDFSKRVLFKKAGHPQTCNRDDNKTENQRF